MIGDAFGMKPTRATDAFVLVNVSVNVPMYSPPP
jgi:hypothetical protein